MRILVTGTAGFVGFHVARRLLREGHDVAGVDGLTPYYDVTLKRQRHQILAQTERFTPHEFMLEDAGALGRTFEQASPEIVIHIAAQAGVRYSLENPASYVQSNLVGTSHLLEQARRMPPRHLLLASTSSVYGMDEKQPSSENDPANRPITLYAATKKSTELMAHAYAHLFGIPTTAFRFFTVYGPWGRPDMAPFKFVANISAGKPIDIFNHGDMRRDFTYIDDLVEAIVRLIPAVPPAPGLDRTALAHDSLSPDAPFRLVNIGNAVPVPLLDFVAEIERALGRKAVRNYLDMQPGDVPQTHADTRLLEALTGFRPSTPIAVGIDQFVAWYRQHYQTDRA